MPANYVLLERIELNASASSVEFTNIPQSGYTDLKVVVSARATTSETGISMQFNGDTSTSNYSYRNLKGNGSAASSSTETSLGFIGGRLDPSTYTSNTFSNNEYYIPNYTGSQQKSVSADTLNENNATAADSMLVAGLWNQTSAITSIKFYVVSSSFAAYSTFSLYGLAATGTTPVIAPKASGGNITTDGTYWIHTFNSTGAFVPSTTLSCDYLVVAGGGGGGGGKTSGGGGGAGGFRTATSQSLTATSYAVTVGAGGAGGSFATQTLGSDGTASSFNSTSSAGGGGGGERRQGTFVYNDGSNGGSGGGAGGASGGGTYVGGLGNIPSTSPSQGNNGGNGGGGSSYGGGGGGGASAVGSTGSTTAGGAGGAGTSNSYSGSAVTYAGGGGGSTYGSGAGGAGGAGGGGAGGTSGGAVGTAGTANLGGGGGAGSTNGDDTTDFAGGKGGSGVVIIRYLVA